ncbi:lytic polysaccharide monooxygenase auxiliary activity family 9 protein [Symbioplanes lichenis]|uniref:lytic polysaccharide monooxygenase auxiliary activity family 9 protein n=1 Tax=Symbioplanes lichenis TaxID=1629072 RepID=UPI002738FB36|nr:lytic polysaccharide monooxygenase [Actinoplanes lichenis]
MKVRNRFLMAAASAILAATAGVVVLTSGPAEAHGAMMVPGSRTYLCWKDSVGATGQVQPKNPACAAAIAQSGPSSMYNWFAVLRSDGAGRTSGFIPDGQPCSGGTGGPYDFTGFNLARNDWPVTHLTSGAALRFDYNNWAKHPGTFRLYITKDTWSPTRALAWSDLESQPFSTVTNPESIGGPGTEDGRYSWTANLPSGKSGRHLIYSVWARSDSQETFYGCSDVVFDGGNGEVTGVGDGTTQPTTPPPSNPTTPPPSNGSCSAAYTLTSSWTGGFQGEIKVTAAAALANWSVRFTWPGGQSSSQAWGGVISTAGTAATVSPESWNRSLAAGGTATVGFLGSGTGPAALPDLACAPV